MLEAEVAIRSGAALDKVLQGTDRLPTPMINYSILVVLQKYKGPNLAAEISYT